MATINKHPNRFELTAVYQHPQAKADIVLVHGLNGAPEKTWTAPNGVYWPTDLLPASLKDQHANVLVYGYNADVYAGFWERTAKNPSDNFIHHHAQDLVTTLTHYRKSEGTERNPIIWVVHSLGGIVTKRALLYSNDVHEPHLEDLRSVVVSTYGIIFLGTPHNGSDAAEWGGVIQRMADALVPKRLLVTEPVLLRSLKKDSETLQQISNHFLDIYQKFHIHMAHENHKTDVRGSKILVVDAESASPQLPGVTYYGIEATHSGMCKFESDHAPGYRTISTAIREWIADAPNVIPIRWEVEEDQRRVRANLENFERARPYQGSALVSAGSQQTIDQSSSSNNEMAPPKSLPQSTRPTSTPLLPTETAQHSDPNSAPLPPSSPQLLPPLPETAERTTTTTAAATTTRTTTAEPLFIHPEAFRPNSYFVGREDELKALHEMLMDRKRRSEGTSAVLIQCLPGGGKTHLARQYVFQHKDDYPGGVYWVRAKSRHELEYWFWRIARNEALRGWIGLDRRDVDELRDPKKIVQIVRRWLNAQREWLVVFDGVQFDIPGLHEFIPDARNTSLIYTSTERAVTGDPRFDNPQVMELGLLTAQQAQDLLLLEMERKRPWSADDRAMALELVQLMGRLPLMIHVAAQHLKATREPLARYLKSYRSRPKAGDLPAYKAVREQLENRGENAALNLISLLVFFDQHLPVEMLALGLSALDKTTPVKASDVMHGKPSLNNTLRVLIAFGLLKRSESDDISPTSSRSSTRSSKRSFDRHTDYLDLLRIHSVVQAYFRDFIHEKRQIAFWLERAIAVWCRSYDEADKRIQEDSRVGLPDDYRRFCIHGEKLRQNLDRYEKRYPSLSRTRPLLQQRLERIQGQIDQLSHAIQKNIIDGSAEEHPVSVFDRISNSSQSDTATVNSHSSQWSGLRSLAGEEDDASELVQSPMAELLEQEGQLQIPYPSTPVMPMPQYIEDDDQETVVSVPETQVYIGAAEMADAVSLPPEPTDVHAAVSSAYDDWQDVIPHHRVIKAQERRRNHNHAGAWRDRTTGDPRVGLSHEVAVGSVSTKRTSSSSPLGPRLTAQSEAEMELNKIKMASPPSRESRGSFGSQTSPRPKMLLGRNSWALPQAQKTPDTEVAQVLPEGSPKGFAQIMSSLKNWRVPAINSPKRPLAPSDISAIKTPSSPLHQVQQPPAEDDLVMPPAPIFRGSRSANSSPASHVSPFPPPSFTGIPTDELMANPGVPLVVRRWDTVVYHPDGTPVTSSGVEWSSPADPLSLSYPSLLPSRQQQHHNAIPARPAILHGGGYSSQPMSRDGSNRSLNPSINITNSPELQVVESPPSGAPSSLLARGVHGRSTSPLQIGGVARPIPVTPISPTSRLSPFNRGRPPSYTETEPSPRLDTPFSDADPREYQPRPMGAAVITGTSLPPGVGTNDDSRGSSSGEWRGSSSSSLARWRASAGRNRIFRVGSNSRKKGKGKARAQSLSSGSASPRAASSSSGSGSPLLSISPGSSSSSVRRRAGSQGQLGHNIQQHQHQHQHPLAAWSTPPVDANVNSPPVDIMMEVGSAPASAGPGTGMSMGGEAMSRSASAGSHGAAGGIRMDDGTVVEFGSPGLGSGSGARNGNRTRSGSSPREMAGMTGLGVWSE